MQTFRTVAELQVYLAARKGRKIAFIPTMGALHQGHLDLVRAAQKQDADAITVCSIFVNPTQFGDPKDLEKYPRTEQIDAHLLAGIGCEVLFLPSVAEIYPADWITPAFDFGDIATTMEGASRVGHFAGVGQVVHRLLSIVKPDYLYLGQKDFQQVAVIKDMVYRQLAWQSPKIVMVATTRESDGLAMSSRNVRLSPAGRAAAAGISKTLFEAKNLAPQVENPLLLQKFVADKYAELGFDVDYVALVNAETLAPITVWPSTANAVVICVVVKIDGVRLLDNILL
jgi:pantoate--beta-alanine ligase